MSKESSGLSLINENSVNYVLLLVKTTSFKMSKIKQECLVIPLNHYIKPSLIMDAKYLDWILGQNTQTD